jgi:excisionase family DNA binding protein
VLDLIALCPSQSNRNMSDVTARSTALTWNRSAETGERPLVDWNRFMASAKRTQSSDGRNLPAPDQPLVPITVPEVAKVLRTSPKAIYAMIARRQLPGVIRISRRVLVDQNALLDWLRQKSSPSSER